MWKSALAGRTRLKGVDKPVDGQRAARPPVCPPPAAFPHTHRRNRKFKKKAQEPEPKSDESNVVLDGLFWRFRTAVKDTEEGHAGSCVIRRFFLNIVISRDNVIIMGDNNGEMIWLQNE
jgi:hypothetical protein